MDHADIDHTGLPGISSGAVATDGIWDAKGDLAIGTGSNTAAKLTAGANGKVPTYASGETTGVIPAYPPGYEFDYVEKTSNTNITATTEAGADTVVTAGAVTYDGSTSIIVEFYSGGLDTPSTSSSNYIQAFLYDGSGSIGAMAIRLGANNDDNRGPVLARRKLTPSAAAHTYSIRAAVGNNNGGSNPGVVEGGAGGSGNKMPAYIRQTKA